MFRGDPKQVACTSSEDVGHKWQFPVLAFRLSQPAIHSFFGDTLRRLAKRGFVNVNLWGCTTAQDGIDLSHSQHHQMRCCHWLFLVRLDLHRLERCHIELAARVVPGALFHTGMSDEALA